MSANLAEVAGDLYGLPPGDFTAARNARAKQVRADGDRELAGRVQSLRKPTAAAWAVNALVRRHPDDVADLLALGAQLLDAQEARAGARLRELNARQHELMAVARRHAESLAADAGQTLTDVVAVQLEGTLRAAMTDPDAADAVRSGLLTAELQSTGFGPVEVGDAVAVAGAPALVPLREAADAGNATTTGTTAGSVPTRAEPTPTATSAEPGGAAPAPARRSRVKVADGAPAREGAAAREREEPSRQAAEDRQDAARRARQEREEAARNARLAAAEEDATLAQQQADEAERALRAAEHAVEALGRRHADLSAEIEELTARLHELESQRTAAGREQRHALTARDAAARSAQGAARRARAARKRFDDLA